MVKVEGERLKESKLVSMIPVEVALCTITAYEYELMKEGLVSPSIAKENVVPAEQGEQGGVSETVRFWLKGSTPVVQGTVVPAKQVIPEVVYPAWGRTTCILLLGVSATPRVQFTVMRYPDST